MASTNVQHRILIVAEEPFLRDVVRSALDGVGAEVYAPSDADQVLRLGDSVPFDLIIVLPITSFASCGGALSRRAEGVRRPVVFVISWQHSEQAVLSQLESGADQYMTFPVNLQRLRQKVADELNRLTL